MKCLRGPSAYFLEISFVVYQEENYIFLQYLKMILWAFNIFLLQSNPAIVFQLSLYPLFFGLVLQLSH